MDDISEKPEFGLILQDAANYRTLRDIIRVLDERSQDAVDAIRRDIKPDYYTRKIQGGF